MSREAIIALRRFTQKLAESLPTSPTMQGLPASSAPFNAGPSDSAQRAMRLAGRSPTGNVLGPDNPAEWKPSKITQPNWFEQNLLGSKPQMTMPELEAMHPNLMGNPGYDTSKTSPPAAVTTGSLGTGERIEPDFNGGTGLHDGPVGQGTRDIINSANDGAGPFPQSNGIDWMTLMKYLGGMGAGGLAGYALGNAFQDEDDDSTPWLSTLAGAGLGTVALPYLLQQFGGGGQQMAGAPPADAPQQA